MGCGGSKSADAKGGKSKGGPTDREQDKQAAKDENKEYNSTMQFLQQVPLLKRLPKDQHPLLAANVVHHDYKAGEKIISQGDSGNEFFVIKSGEATVSVMNEGKSTEVAKLKSGDYFGENALLRDEPRTATITAINKLSTMKLSREKFQELGLHEKLEFAKRQAVAGGAKLPGATAKPPSDKTKADRELIAEALRKNDKLMTMVNLDEPRINQLIDIAWKETIEQGRTVIEEGDLVADYFYIVAQGEFEVLISEGQGDNGPTSAEKALKQDAKHIAQVNAGGCFGELALLYLVPRAASVVAKVNSVVWVIDRNNFKNILMRVSDEKIVEYVKLLDGVEILNSLLQDEKKEVAKALLEMHFQRGENVLQQGEPGNTFYILWDGEVEVVKDDQIITKLTAEKNKVAQYFGERALLDNERRAATVRVCSKEARALALDRDAFNMLLGSLEDIIKKDADIQSGGGRTSVVKGDKRIAGVLDEKRERIVRKDLNKLGLLGCGGFGTVELWEHKTKGTTYAMKSLSKGYIVKTGMQDSVMNEKHILSMTNSPFVIKLYETYNGQQSLYFLLEAALGGELYATYHRKGFHGSEKHAKYYVSGVVCAFEHLHDRRILYRDLKPENLLLNSEGHLKLTDMGLAKFVIGRTYTTCGTPDYFAPELIASTGHNRAVDWWTLGVLIFELLSGHPPFESAYPMQIYSKVMKGVQKIPFPQKCQGAAGDLIKALLKKEASERLAMRPGGVDNIKTHKWFANFDWAAMISHDMSPPYVPIVKSPKDMANFSARKEDMPRQIEYHDDGSGWDKDFAI